MPQFTPTQGRYLAFIHAYTSLHGCPPAESEIGRALLVSPPSVNQMIVTLEKKGLILRQPGVPRSIRILVPEAEIPPWSGKRGAAQKAAQSATPTAAGGWVPAASAVPPATLYVLKVFLCGGPIEPQFENREISRALEIRGDQTLDQLHHAIFQAYDRTEQHAYEFQLGRRPHDPEGPDYGIAAASGKKKATGGDARTTTLDQLGLKQYRTFGYWFDFGDNWYHQVQVEKIESAIPTVTYPRVRRRVGKSPPQYPASSDAAGEGKRRARQSPRR